MKQLLCTLACSVAVAMASAVESNQTAKVDGKYQVKPAEKEVQLEEVDDLPLFWGFGNYGMYSGYQLYGSLVNCEPTLQGYLEGNMNLLFGDYDLGYFGIGIWSNSDLTKQRDRNYGRAFNEWDFNVHWGKTFWLDDDQKYGIDYRTSVVWYYYPHHWYQDKKPYGKTDTTVDWNHSFAFVNPWVVPFLDVVHEYHESDGNLLQGGLKRLFEVSDKFSLTPSATFVWRNSHYNWCFPTGFGTLNHGSGLATMKLELDANYKLSDHFGLFAKVAYCSIIDPDLRDNIDNDLHGADYGDAKDFAWGGVGITVNF